MVSSTVNGSMDKHELAKSSLSASAYWNQVVLHSLCPVSLLQDIEEGIRERQLESYSVQISEHILNLVCSTVDLKDFPQSGRHLHNCTIRR